MSLEVNALYINEELSIPLSELAFRFTTSGGPGGQHANRSATRAVLSFDVANSPSLTEEQRERLLEKLASRLDKQGVLQIAAQDTRSQHQNREAAAGRLQFILSEALKEEKPRRKTRKPQAVDEQRLEEKRQQSQKKQDRSQKWEEG